jgi:murein DD-endopeptidase MepM/ murein hydrolase activator NlpD
MTKRFYTFIIVPNASSRLHKVRIPMPVMYVLAAIGFVSFFVAVGMGFSYARMAFKISDYNTLQTENMELKVEKKNLEVTTLKLSSKLTDLEKRSDRLTELIENDETLKKLRGKNGAGGTKTDFRTSDIIHGTPTNDIDTLKSRASELENQMTLNEQKAAQRALIKRYTPTIWPLRGRVASHFGGRLDPFTGTAGDVHLGLDITGIYGSPVRSPADGLVIFAGRKSDYGNLIIIDHGNGVTTRLGHLSRFEVKVGRTVSKGEIVGNVGMTGRTTGPHLHYEVRLNDRPVNPRLYLPPDGD